MSKATDTRTDALGFFPYVLGTMSVLPEIGFLFGIVAIVWGLVTKKSGGKLLAAIGAIGTVVPAIYRGGFGPMG